MNDEVTYPIRCHIELTDKCNYKCKICKHGYENYGEDISDNVYEKFCDEILPHLEEIELQGTGEALLGKHFWNLFDKIVAEDKCRMNLITNGSIMNRDIAKKFVAANMQLVVSLDGSQSKYYSMNRPVGEFEKVVKNISIINEERRNNSNNNFSLCVNMVLTRQNYDSLVTIISLCEQLGIDFVMISEVRKCSIPDSEWNQIRLDNFENRAGVMLLLEACKEEAKEKNIGFLFNSYVQDRFIKKDICISPWRHVFINRNGEVSVCCELNKYFGTLEKQSFDDIWNGIEINSFRNKMLMKEYNDCCKWCCLPWGITNE